MNKKQIGMTALALGALGVVFGDIGTSPLYAFLALVGIAGKRFTLDQNNIYGVISLIIWAVVVVVCVKYIAVLMRADNGGEGGIMALTALIKKTKIRRRRWLLILLGIAGVCLFYGDSAITPSISLLSAVEGMKVIRPSLSGFVVPVTVLIAVLLFGLQRFGTSAIGKLFGPIMLVWFAVIAVAGVANIWQHPSVLVTLCPLTAIDFFVRQPGLGFISLTAVVLAITGAEALYADMGHFGRRPIARAWFFVVFPALMLCYMGQGALLAHNPAAISSPFYHLFPSSLFIPVVILATLATLIASQSVISGAFSLTRQAVQLGFLPNLTIRHTSDQETGQVYLPFVNIMLFVVVAGLILAFRSSRGLAGAYGVAISGALLMDSVLFAAMILKTRLLSRWTLVLAFGLFLPLELLFFSSNLTKIVSGGWFPLAVAVVIFVIITTWIKGERLVAETRRRLEGSLADYVQQIQARQIERVPGEAVYIGHHAGFAPLALHASVDQLHELPQKIVVVVVKIADLPHIAPEKRARFDPLGSTRDHISYLELTFGYHDTPNVPRALSYLQDTNPELRIDVARANYFVSLTKIVPASRHMLSAWRRSLYLFMARNRRSSSDHYRLPPERTIDMEAVIEL